MSSPNAVAKLSIEKQRNRSNSSPLDKMSSPQDMSALSPLKAVNIASEKHVVASPDNTATSFPSRSTLNVANTAVAEHSDLNNMMTPPLSKRKTSPGKVATLSPYLSPLKTANAAAAAAEPSTQKKRERPDDSNLDDFMMSPPVSKRKLTSAKNLGNKEFVNKRLKRLDVKITSFNNLKDSRKQQNIMLNNSSAKEATMTKRAAKSEKEYTTADLNLLKARRTYSENTEKMEVLKIRISQYQAEYELLAGKNQAIADDIYGLECKRQLESLQKKKINDKHCLQEAHDIAQADAEQLEDIERAITLVGKSMGENSGRQVLEAHGIPYEYSWGEKNLSVEQLMSLRRGMKTFGLPEASNFVLIRKSFDEMWNDLCAAFGIAVPSCAAAVSGADDEQEDKKKRDALRLNRDKCMRVVFQSDDDDESDDATDDDDDE